MGVSPFAIYGGQKCLPCWYPEAAKTTAVLLAPGVQVTRGTVLGELSAQNEVQRIDIINATGGTFTVTIGANTTSALAYNVSAAAMQTALRALASVGGANLTVTGTVAGALGPGSAGQYVVTFIGTLAGASQSLVGLTSSLTGNNPLAIVERLKGGGSAASGVYAAYVDGNSDGTQVARAIAQYDAVADSAGNVTLTSLSTQVGDDHGGTELSMPVYISGWFRTEDLTGLDAAGVTDLGRLVEGTITRGVLRVE